MKYARVCSGGSGIVRKAEPVPVLSSPFVENTLVTAIPTAARLDQLTNLLEFVLSRCQYHHARVKNVWPSDIWHSTELIGQCEEVGELTNWEDIGVQEDYLRILREAKDVQLGKHGAQVGPTCFKAQKR